MKTTKVKKVVDLKGLVGHRLLMEYENHMGKPSICEVKILEISPLGIIKLDPMTLREALFSSIWVHQSEFAERTILEDLGIEKV
jgi:hypothetical protein